MRLRHLLLAAGCLLAVGCHAQVAPTIHGTTLNWVAPTIPSGSSWGGCTTSNPCSYIVSRITITSGSGACPAVNLTTPNYTPLNQSSPTSALTYSDNSSAGLTVCYIVQTDQNGSISGPSAVGGPWSPLANPNSPSAPSGTTN